MLIDRVEALNIYYDDIIKPDLVRLEKFMKMNKLIGTIAMIAFLLALFGIFIYVTGVIAAVGIVIILLTKGTIDKQYKNKIVIPLMDQLGEAFHFDYAQGLSEDDLRASRLFDMAHKSELKTSKLTTYTQKERTLWMSYVKLITKRNSLDQDTDYDTHTSLFVKVPTQLNIKTTTMIWPDLGERVAGYTGQLTQSKTYDELSMIRLDSPEFEKYYIVYGGDNIEAHYLLNHSVMESILALDSTAHALFITFIPGYIYINIGIDWLEPHVVLDGKKEVLSFEDIKQDFELIFNLIDTINAIEKHHYMEDKQ